MRHYRTFLNVFVVFFCALFFLGIKIYNESQSEITVVGAGGYRRMEDPSFRGEDTQARLSTTVTIASASSLSPSKEDTKKMYWMSLKESPRTTWILTRGVYFIMALLDTISLYLSILSSSSVTTPFRALIQQGAIPVSMLVSWIVFERIPAKSHVFAATLIIVGIAATSWQIFADRKVADYSNTDGETSTGWGVIFFISTVFMALGGCLKEWAMMHPTHPLDMNDLNFWVALNQLLLALLLSPAGYLLQHAGDTPASIHDLPDNFVDGFKCGVLGIGRIEGPDIVDDDVPDHVGPCKNAVLSTFVYVVVVCSYNMLMLWVIREETVVLFFIASAITMPLVALLSASDLFTHLGLMKVTFSPWQVAGFVVVIFGMIVYRVLPESDSDEGDGDSVVEDEGVVASPYARDARDTVPWLDTPKARSRDFDSELYDDDEDEDGLLHPVNFSSFGGDTDGLAGLGFSPESDTSGGYGN